MWVCKVLLLFACLLIRAAGAAIAALILGYVRWSSNLDFFSFILGGASLGIFGNVAGLCWLIFRPKSRLSHVLLINLIAGILFPFAVGLGIEAVAEFVDLVDLIRRRMR